MATATLINQFTVTQVPVTVNSDIRFNIIKRREIILYKAATLSNYVNISYVVNQELNSQQNLFISDKSTQLSANKIPENIEPIVFHGKTITLLVDKFKATDVFVTSVTQEKVPLFYKHILKNFNSEDSSTTIHDFSIRNKDLQSIDFSNTIFDKINGIVYNNLQNNLDTFYYINYSISDGTVINSYTEILDNELIFIQATIDDLGDTGALIPTRKVYLIEGLSSNVFEIVFPTSTYYGIIEEPNSRIRLLKPPSTDNRNNWFVSVTNGNFFSTIFTSPTTYTIFKYNIPEFNTQLFTPEPPFKFRTSDICTQIDNNLIKVLKNNIITDTNKYVDVILRNPDGTARLALTTNPSKINSTFEDTVAYQNSIRSIDRLNGIIDLSINVKDNDIIEASYYFSETEYEVLDIDFNPINNTDILNKRLVFYIVPNTNDSRNKTLYYLIVNRQGVIEVGNQIDNLSLTADIASGNFTYDKQSIDSNHLNFIDKYTVQASILYKFTNSINPKFLVLGEVYVANNSHPDKSVTFDIRKQGGGIRKVSGLLNELALIDPEITWITEVGGWDGTPYPGNGSMVIELPAVLQKQNGGLFTNTELREIVERHMGFGMYSILRAYISDIEPVVETI